MFSLPYLFRALFIGSNTSEYKSAGVSVSLLFERLTNGPNSTSLIIADKCCTPLQVAFKKIGVLIIVNGLVCKFFIFKQKAVKTYLFSADKISSLSRLIILS